MLKLLSKWIQEEKSLKFYLQQHFLQCTKVCIYINHNRLSRFNAMSFLICCRLSFCGFVGGAAPSRRWSLYMLVYVRTCVCVRVGVSVCVCVSRASWHLNCVLLIVKLLLWAAKWPTGRMRNAHYAYVAWPQFEEKMRNMKCENIYWVFAADLRANICSVVCAVGTPHPKREIHIFWTKFNLFQLAKLKLKPGGHSEQSWRMCV